MTKSHGINLSKYPINLGLGATAVVQPEFSGDMDWYVGYGQRHGGDGIEARLVSMHTFTESWDSWEMHPKGSEVVVCVAGEMTLVQEAPDGEITETTLKTGEYAINQPGVWHTAQIEASATALFITSGDGTEHRPV